MTTQTSPLNVAPAVPRKQRSLHIENSILGTIVRRWTFLSRYLASARRSKMVRRFEPIVQKHFQHEWLADSQVHLRFLPGNEEREWRIRWPSGRTGEPDKFLVRFRPMPWRAEECQAKWGAPVCVTVLKKGRDGGRGKPETVRYMSMFFKNRVLHIAQLQGVPLIEMPKGLRDWAERFVHAAMEFARQENLRGVWIIRADALYSYHYPWLRPGMPDDARERELKRIRSNMEIHHDQTARNLGFTPDGDWYKWINPEHKTA